MVNEVREKFHGIWVRIIDNRKDDDYYFFAFCV